MFKYIWVGIMLHLILDMSLAYENPIDWFRAGELFWFFFQAEKILVFIQDSTEKAKSLSAGVAKLIECARKAKSLLEVGGKKAKTEQSWVESRNP